MNKTSTITDLRNINSSSEERQIIKLRDSWDGSQTRHIMPLRKTEIEDGWERNLTINDLWTEAQEMGIPSLAKLAMSLKEVPFQEKAAKEDICVLVGKAWNGDLQYRAIHQETETWCYGRDAGDVELMTGDFSPLSTEQEANLRAMEKFAPLDLDLADEELPFSWLGTDVEAKKARSHHEDQAMYEILEELLTVWRQFKELKAERVGSHKATAQLLARFEARMKEMLTSVKRLYRISLAMYHGQIRTANGIRYWLQPVWAPNLKEGEVLQGPPTAENIGSEMGLAKHRWARVHNSICKTAVAGLNLGQLSLEKHPTWKLVPERPKDPSVKPVDFETFDIEPLPPTTDDAADWEAYLQKVEPLSRGEVLAEEGFWAIDRSEAIQQLKDAGIQSTYVDELMAKVGVEGYKKALHPNQFIIKGRIGAKRAVKAFLADAITPAPLNRAEEMISAGSLYESAVDHFGRNPEKVIDQRRSAKDRFFSHLWDGRRLVAKI